MTGENAMHAVYKKQLIKLLHLGGWIVLSCSDGATKGSLDVPCEAPIQRIDSERNLLQLVAAAWREMAQEGSWSAESLPVRGGDPVPKPRGDHSFLARIYRALSNLCQERKTRRSSRYEGTTAERLVVDLVEVVVVADICRDR